MGSARTKGLLILLIALIGLAGCSSTEQKIERLNQAVQSWQTTARLTEQLRERGAVPQRYSRQVLDAAAREMETARQRLQKTLR
jgi:outer membrane murein-binding lipoprotein Lpp